MQTSKFDTIADGLQTYKSSFDCEDAVRRTCIGRYYYHIFHEVKSWLLSEHNDVFIKFNGKTHEQLRFCCDELAKKYSNRDFQMIQMKLKNLHDLRVRSDYKLDDKISEGDLLTVKIEKDRILKLVNGLKNKTNTASPA